jgi:hypothetical protein
VEMTLFWDSAPCRLVEAYRRFIALDPCIITAVTNHAGDGGSKHV